MFKHIATDYCVKFTALDAVPKEKLNATLIRDATRGVELAEGDVQRAVDQMQIAGVRVIESTELLD